MVQRPSSVPTCAGSGQVPVRTCVGCRGRALIDELLRVSVVDGQLVVDEHRRLPGRGAWLHPAPECLSKAIRRRAFPKALRVTGALDTDGLHHYLRRPAELDS